ncbi:hypothetical protein, partial [Bartonella sp. TT110JLCBS]|uniref:hypothetical protein n=1 Tax=Bartonella sp. TT110JLCBS TaxID=3243578 RepID=UPI0035CF4590
IRDHHVGIIAKDMHDAQRQVLQMTPGQYHEMVMGIDHYANLIREGIFTKRAFAEAFFKLFNN